jgi:hypothetical protein
MSVNVNTVYQTTLSLLNKEQRGYLTPQQFNLFANQAQLDLFEQYFYDINQFGRVPGNSTEYSDMLEILDQKTSSFEVLGFVPAYYGGGLIVGNQAYRTGTVMYNGIECRRVSAKELLQLRRSPLVAPSDTMPVYVEKRNTATDSNTSFGVLNVFGTGTAEKTSGVTLNYIRFPVAPRWDYNIVFGETLYYQSSSVNFELHKSEETELVMKILELASIAIEDIQLYQVAAGEESKNIQQQKA